MDQRTRKLLIIYKALDPRDDIDCMCQEKEEKHVRAFKIASMHQYNGLKITLKKRRGRLITTIRNNTDNTRKNKTKITRK